MLHLENVLTELYAVTIRDGLAFPNDFVNFEEGRPLDLEAPEYAKAMLNSGLVGRRPSEGTCRGALPRLTTLRVRSIRP